VNFQHRKYHQPTPAEPAYPNRHRVAGRCLLPELSDTLVHLLIPANKQIRRSNGQLDFLLLGTLFNPQYVMDNLLGEDDPGPRLEQWEI
jgi:hypothetical protein